MVAVQDFGDSNDTSPAQAVSNSLNKPLDVIFLQDTTGSQGPYIVAARKAIQDICDKISSGAGVSKDLLRFGLLAFRDHPPMEMTYVTKNFGFTSDVATLERNLASLIASGGGDGPEAQTAALAEALNTEWAEDAMKIIILITDSPPHGLGERGDHFDKSPDQNDPLELARQMAEHGITLFVIACEPALSSYMNAIDFYSALTEITSGRVLPLLMANKLGDYIVGTVVETVETERLIQEFEQIILDDVYNKSQPMEAVADNLQQFIADRGGQIMTMNIDDIYTPSETALQNKSKWAKAANLSAVRETVVPVAGTRIQQQYMTSLEALAASSDATSFKKRTKRGDDGKPSTRQRSCKKRKNEMQDEPVTRDWEREREREIEPVTRDGEVQRRRSSKSEFSVGSYSTAKEPSAYYAKATISKKQAARIVQQSVARSSKVTTDGYISKITGQSVPHMDT